MNEYNNCKERESKVEKYEDEIEKEKVHECLKALEREKIANGMNCTKIDEIKLREMQRMQMQEKKFIEQSQAEIDELWHQVLINDVKFKEEKERSNAERLKQEMYDRRLAYDEQIAISNRKRQEAMQNEREIENKRLQKMKMRMEQDYYDAIKKKKDQQLINKRNFIEGHKTKLSRIEKDKIQEREMDIKAIHVAREELRREKLRKLNQIQMLKNEKEVFIENFNRERKIANELEKESNRITSEWKEHGEKENDEFLKKMELEKQNSKLKAAQEYMWHIEKKKRDSEKKRVDRKFRMDKVKSTAYEELSKNLENANEELRRQIEYRNTLTNQIKANEKMMEIELNEIERKQRPFTKKAIIFKDAMKDKFSHLSTRQNPVHPFKKVMEMNEVNNRIPLLPFLNKSGI